jgi:hypothetical protein
MSGIILQIIPAPKRSSVRLSWLVSREKSAGMSQIIFGFEKKLQEREKTTYEYIRDVFPSTASEE